MSNETRNSNNKNSKALKGRRPATVSVAGTSNVSNYYSDVAMPVLDNEARRTVYDKYLRELLEECIVDDKVDREDTFMDVEMAQLADRFQKTIDMLDRTNKKIKDVSFTVEKKRLIDLKNKDCTNLYNTNSSYDDFTNKEAYVNSTQTDTNIIQNGDSGHKQLLNVVTEAIDNLAEIKKDSKLDKAVFNRPVDGECDLEKLEENRLDLKSIKLDFESKFPNFSEQLFMEASQRIRCMIDGDE